MAAPDLETLLNFEANTEPALGTLLTEKGIREVDLRLGTGNLRSGRVDVELTMGAATGRLYIPANLPDGALSTEQCFEDAWHFVIAFNVVTVRDLNPELHAAYRAKIRELMLRNSTLITADVLPYYALSAVRSAGTTVNLLTAKDEDYSQLRYSGAISVRKDAWPAPYG